MAKSYEVFTCLAVSVHEAFHTHAVVVELLVNTRPSIQTHVVRLTLIQLCKKIIKCSIEILIKHDENILRFCLRDEAVISGKAELKDGASGRNTTPRLNVVDYLTSLVRTGYTPIIMLEETGSVRGSRSMHKMAATTWHVA